MVQMKKFENNAILHAVSTLSDVTNTSAGILDAIYDQTIILRALEAGPGITINVVDADNNIFSTSQRKIVISASGAGTTSSSGGEINVGQNVGTGSGIYSGKTGVALNFKTLVPGDDITITSSSTEIGISSNAVNDGQNLGAGYIKYRISGTFLEILDV